METTASPQSSGHVKLLFGLGALIALTCVAWGFKLDAQVTITQPDLFWSLLVSGLSGSLLGWRVAMRNDSNPLRNLIGLVGSLVAWRVSYFPFMVLAGWKASLVEFTVWNTAGTNVVYPAFLFFMFIQHAGVGFIGAAAVASPQNAPPDKGRLLWVRRLFHKPPRKLLWALAVVALPVAAMVSFSTADDFVLFNDGPNSELATPPISQPESNPYDQIIAEHDMSLPAWVLAKNAAMTYPLVPESPWGSAIKGTLEKLTLARPVATTRDRVDEHYQAYMAAHPRLHDKDAK